MRLAFLKAIGLASAIIVARAGPVQFPDLTVPSSAAADLASVAEVFKELRCITGAHKGIPGRCPRLTFVDGCHREFAFSHDEVAPIQHKGLDPRIRQLQHIVGQLCIRLVHLNY
jgi:hypothetical protein